VEEDRRTRVLEALAEAMAERGPAASTVTVAEVIARSGVTNVAFEELFVDREGCLLAAFDLGVERAAALTVAAFEAESRWLDAIKAALAGLLRFLEDEPALGRLMVVYSMGGGARVLRRRMEVLGLVAAVVDRGRAEMPPGKQDPPPVIAEGVVGAVVTVLQSRLLAEDPQPLAELFGALTSMIVLPYLGSGVARRELTRPVPRLRAVDDRTSSAPAARGGHETGTRLTYRTARVLTAIEDYPGASNREVAERAGIVDQGQISKLLSRLEARKLIEKLGEGKTRGAPNAWRLTEQGESLMSNPGMRGARRGGG
jgi:DNA-binding MarR family transcriptional regulator/AcrR family transcriptional regulator